MLCPHSIINYSFLEYFWIFLTPCSAHWAHRGGEVPRHRGAAEVRLPEHAVRGEGVRGDQGQRDGRLGQPGQVTRGNRGQADQDGCGAIQVRLYKFPSSSWIMHIGLDEWSILSTNIIFSVLLQTKIASVRKSCNLEDEKYYRRCPGTGRCFKREYYCSGERFYLGASMTVTSFNSKNLFYLRECLRDYLN